MSNMTYSWKGKEGQDIYARTWSTPSPKAVLCIVHGLGEHIGRYQAVADKMNEKGIAVMGYDHPGHGQTTGQRGHVGSYDYLLDEVETLIGKAKSQYPNLPIFLYGHSMGGNVGINYLLRRQPSVKAAIITGPWLELPAPPPAIKYFLGKMMRNIYPKFNEHTALDSSAISRDPKIVEAYKADPLVHDNISASFFMGCFEAAAYALAHAEELNTPTLLMHGQADRLTSWKGSEKFAAKAGKMVEFIPWEGAFHELHNDLIKDQAVNKMIEFLNQHI